MPTNIGTQTVTIKYFDPLNSSVLNRIGLDVRKTGIYSGGYLTKVSDVSVSLSPLICEISDGTYQVRVETTEDVSITVSSTLTYIVLRWIYTGVAADDYMALLGIAVGSLLSTDLIVGVCSYTGITLNGFSYTLRSNPQIMDLFLKVEPTVPASMYVRVRAGRVNYGSVNYDILDQLSPLLVAPISGTTVYAIQVNTSGAVIATANTTTPPDYGGLVTLAEITIPSGTTTLPVARIKDVRSFGASGNVIPLPITSGGTGSITKNFVDLTTGQTVAGVKTFSSSPIVPTPTTNMQAAPKLYADTLDAVQTAKFHTSTGHDHDGVDSKLLGNIVAKAWVSFTGATGVILSSYNISGVVHNSTGVWTVSFTNAFADTNYCFTSSFITTDMHSTLYVESVAIGSLVIRCNSDDSGHDARDPTRICIAVFA